LWSEVRILSRLRNHSPQQRGIRLAFHQQAADELGCNLLGGAGEEGLRGCWEGLGGYGSGVFFGGIDCRATD